MGGWPLTMSVLAVVSGACEVTSGARGQFDNAVVFRVSGADEWPRAMLQFSPLARECQRVVTPRVPGVCLR